VPGLRAVAGALERHEPGQGFHPGQPGAHLRVGGPVEVAFGQPRDAALRRHPVKANDALTPALQRLLGRKTARCPDRHSATLGKVDVESRSLWLNARRALLHLLIVMPAPWSPA
jgi:hypothetical protein